jgi:hypothetical protein
MHAHAKNWKGRERREKKARTNERTSRRKKKKGRWDQRTERAAGIKRKVELPVPETKVKTTTPPTYQK